MPGKREVSTQVASLGEHRVNPLEANVAVLENAALKDDELSEIEGILSGE